MDTITDSLMNDDTERPAQNSRFTHVVAMMCALALFVAGRFGFFDILGLKRLFEILLFIPISMIGILFILISPRLWYHPFLLLPFSYLAFQLFWHPDWLSLADLTIATVMVGTILALGQDFSDLLLRYVIRIATFFAVLGLIEFVILIINPSLVSKILLFYDFYSGSNVPVIQNAMQLLGLSDGTSYHLWGLSVTRLRSFTSEPSLLVGYFLVPGALALTYRDQYATYGFICILFCICSLAGSVYAALGFSMLSTIVVISRKREIVVLLPFMFLCAFMWVLYNHYGELILMAKSMGGDYDFLDKTNSANMRFSYIRDFVPKVMSSPLGLEEELHQPLGLLIGSAAHSGILGFVLAAIVLFKLYTRLSFHFVSHSLHHYQKLGLLIIYGSLLTGIIYLDNCFIQTFGFTLLVLVYNRLGAINSSKSLYTS